jgi:hypothetical protein
LESHEAESYMSLYEAVCDEGNLTELRKAG